MLSNHAKGAVLFASIYFIVLLLSSALFFYKPALASANPSVTNSVMATPTAGASSSRIETLVAELLLLSGLVIAEMRHKLLSRTYTLLKKHIGNMHPLLRAFLSIAIGIELLFLVFRDYGLVIALFFLINCGAISLIWMAFMRRASLRQAVPVLISFVSFFILWPFAILFASGNIISEVLVEFFYLPVFFLVAVLAMRNPTKNRLNFMAFVFSISIPPLLGTLFLPLYAIILLGIFSVYDFIAVFWTKHMGFMASRLLSMNIPEAFLIGDFDLIKERLRGIDKKAPQLPEGVDRPLIFGVGDAILPSVVISAFALGGHFYLGFVVTAGATVGVVANLLVLRMRKSILPALPLIFIFMMAALLLAQP